ncbi:flagellar basal body-associated FliL family protein [Xenophilus arseniciresistens]|uniref:Flagellar protein FliL n=1 Tax=Xenophilus arseniciresistens TaxID=1283306 RepID=A0AAE3N7B1_9BURK|nr:flagellar basal body-associated FliL family protein [Xenophilus arseniciresistens]MDA7415227.1 flagellar basal body-associated FliL family protein [Xenophilus arseniciresistens]
MSATPADSQAPAPKAKGKLLIILLAALIVAAGAAAGGWFYLQSRKNLAAQAQDEAHEAPAAKRATPTYLALENMVVNLADAGGERMVQIGITLDLNDAKVVDEVKSMMPAVRNSVLLLVSQRSSEELLKLDGKEKLAADVRDEISRALGYDVPRAAARGQDGDDADERPRRRTRVPASPVNGVLFSAFIVQ